VLIVEDSIDFKVRKLETEFFAEVNKIFGRIDHLLNYVKENTSRIDDLDQERRACSLIFHGVPESDIDPPDLQVFDIMKNKLEIPIPAYTLHGVEPVMEQPEYIPPFVIARAFRMGKPRTVAQIAKLGPRPIMVYFRSLYFRDKVFMAKRCLRGSKLFICESLTRSRYERLLRVREIAGPKIAWSAEGKVFILYNDVKKRITKLEDLNI
jgi:hypothetical protein